eukprot:6936006-Prymnesium_polylepis.1
MPGSNPDAEHVDHTPWIHAVQRRHGDTGLSRVSVTANDTCSRLSPRSGSCLAHAGRCAPRRCGATSARVRQSIDTYAKRNSPRRPGPWCGLVAH